MCCKFDKNENKNLNKKKRKHVSDNRAAGTDNLSVKNLPVKKIYWLCYSGALAMELALRGFCVEDQKRI